MRAIAAAVLALATTAAGAAQPASWYLQVDNDVVFGTDRGYSSGVRIARVAPAGDAATEWGIHQEIYSPEGKRWAPGVDDRMPTGRLFAYGARHQFGAGTFDTFELALGVRGPASLGERASDALHRIASAADIDWSRQDGDRFDGRFAAVRSQAWGEVLVAHYGAVLGNELAFAHVGLEARVGSARLAHTPALRFAPTPPPKDGTGWGAFAGVSARVVGVNELIGPNYDPFGPALEARRSVARGVVGVTYLHHMGAAVLAIVHDTREFSAQRQPYGFGSLTIRVDF